MAKCDLLNKISFWRISSISSLVVHADHLAALGLGPVAHGRLLHRDPALDHPETVGGRIQNLIQDQDQRSLSK